MFLHLRCHFFGYQTIPNLCLVASLPGNHWRNPWESGRFSIFNGLAKDPDNQGPHKVTHNWPRFGCRNFSDWVSDYLLNSFLNSFKVLSFCLKAFSLHMYQYVTHVEECLLNCSIVLGCFWTLFRAFRDCQGGTITLSNIGVIGTKDRSFSQLLLRNPTFSFQQSARVLQKLSKECTLEKLTGNRISTPCIMCTSCAHHVLVGSPSYSLWWTSRHRCHWKNNDTAQIQCQNGGWLCPLADCMNLRWIYMTAMVKAVSNQCIPLAAPLWSPYAWLRSCDIGCVFHHMSQL